MPESFLNARVAGLLASALGLATALAAVDALFSLEMTDHWGSLWADPVTFGRSLMWLSLTYLLVVLVAAALLRDRVRVAGCALAGIVLAPGGFWLVRTLRGWELWLFLGGLAVGAAVLGVLAGWWVRRSRTAQRFAYTLAALLIIISLLSHVSPSRTGSRSTAAPPWPDSAAGEPTEDSGRPNIVLFTLDTVRSDHLSPYGYTGITTPSLDRLAAEGTLFEAAVAQAPITPVSHASLLTGLFPVRHGLRSFDHKLADHPDVTTLASHLKAAGYVTGAIVTSAALDPFYGLGVGFDFYHHANPNYFYPFEGCKLAVLAWLLDKLQIIPNRNDYRSQRAITKDALNFIETYKEQPFFLWVHYFDAHSPYHPEPIFLRSEYHPDKRFFDRFRLTYRYDSELLTVDSGIGRVLAALDEWGLLPKTIVVAVADHGEGHGEHGYVGHARRIYQEQLRIPLILRYPTRIPAGLRVHSQVRAIDLMPTLLELANRSLPPRLDGESLLPLLTEGGNAPSRFSFSELIMDQGRVHLLAASDGRFKLIRDGDGKLELFDLERDPGENIDLSDELPGVRARLASSVDAYLLQQSPDAIGDGIPESDAGLREQLRALGYVQ